MNSIASLINVETERRGWSLRQVAEKARVSHTTIVELANGSRQATLKTCQALALAFNMPVEELVRMAELLPSRNRPVRERRIVYEVDGEALVLELWRALSPMDQAIVRELMERLAPANAPHIIGAPSDEAP